MTAFYIKQKFIFLFFLGTQLPDSVVLVFLCVTVTTVYSICCFLFLREMLVGSIFFARIYCDSDWMFWSTKLHLLNSQWTVEVCVVSFHDSSDAEKKRGRVRARTKKTAFDWDWTRFYTWMAPNQIKNEVFVFDLSFLSPKRKHVRCESVRAGTFGIFFFE